MDEKRINRNEEMEIDLQRLFFAILQRWWQVLAATILCGILAFIGTTQFITPMYQSGVMFYVNNNSFSVGETAISLSSADITASKSLVDSYIVILKTRTTLNDVIDYAGVDRTYGEMKNMISAASVNGTEIFQVLVTSPDPEEAEKIADAVEYILPNRIGDIIEGTSARIVDTAIMATTPVSPNVMKNTSMGLMLGCILCVGVIVLKELFDTTIRTEEDVTSETKHPILASVPDIMASSKGEYYYESSSSSKRSQKKRKKKVDLLKAPAKKEAVLVGGGISFAATEAYKLLRTKLQFSFADESDCHLIGVSSALAGEGKSLTSINLAYSLAQLDKRVLLIDCDLRKPTIAQKLPIEGDLGLSNYLTRQVQLESIIQICKMDESATFNVIASGPTPPNPIELLSSTRMSKGLEDFRDYYDYIILDLPPVEEVSDAMVVAKITDGMLLVTRQDYCDRHAFNSAIREFEFIQAKLLGIVYNCATENGVAYGRKYGKNYYRKYGKKYYSYKSYRRSYQVPAVKGESQEERDA